MADKSKIDRANAQFQKLQRAEDGKKAMSEYEAGRVAVLANTERLRALRLARDAAAQSLGTAASKPPREKKTTPGTLTSRLSGDRSKARRG